MRTAKMDARIQPMPLLGLLILVSMVLFFGLDLYPLANGSEGQQAEVAREMIALNQFTIPYFNFTPHLESPPLYNWITAFSYQLFGISAGSARLFSAIASLIALVSVIWFCHCCDRIRLGWITVCMLLSSLGFVWVSRTATSDASFMAALAVSLFYYYLWIEEKKSSSRLFSHIAFSAAVMLKGGWAPYLLLPVILLCPRYFEDCQIKARTYFTLSGFAIVLLPYALWLTLLYMQQPALISHYYALPDSLPPIAQWHFLYYAWPLLLFAFPWVFFLPHQTIYLIKRWYYLNNFNRFCLIWFCSNLLAISLLPVKSPHYMIYLSLPLTLLLAQQVERTIDKCKGGLLRNCFYWLAALSLMVTVSFSVLIYKHDNLLTHSEQLAMIASGCMTLYVLVGFILNFVFRHRQVIAFYLNVALIIPVMIISIVVAKQGADYYSEQRMASLVDKHFSMQPLFVYQDVGKFSSLVFYTINHVNVIKGSADSVLFPDKNIPTRFAISRVDSNDFKKLATTRSVLVTLDNNEELINFVNEMLPLRFCEVFRDGKALLISNQKSNCHRARIALVAKH